MKRVFFLGLAGLALATTAATGPAAAQHRDQQRAWDATRRGELLPSREIERRVVPTMRGAQYLGFDFDGESSIYTLKFLRDGNVIWVEVDGRSGAVLGRTGR